MARAKEDLAAFRGLLADATAGMPPEYFLLPVTNTDGGQPLVEYRERVYAYELYHQLRRRWPEWRYSLAGEVDKTRHPIVHGGDLDRAKPDLLVHAPGNMNHNLAVLEIKPLRMHANTDERRAIMRDMEKLVAFRAVGYIAAILLVFGEDIDRVRHYGRQYERSGIDLALVELYHHRHPGTSARAVDW